MRRREFITLLGGAAAGWPLAARAQQGERMRRIGVLLTLAESDPEVKAWLTAFQEGLQQLGWAQGSQYSDRLSLGWWRSGALEDLRG
jgi:putative ABC transport system substrate-binding protein